MIREIEFRSFFFISQQTLSSWRSRPTVSLFVPNSGKRVSCCLMVAQAPSSSRKPHRRVCLCRARGTSYEPAAPRCNHIATRMPWGTQHKDSPSWCCRLLRLTTVPAEWMDEWTADSAQSLRVYSTSVCPCVDVWPQRTLKLRVKRNAGRPGSHGDLFR